MNIWIKIGLRKIQVQVRRESEHCADIAFGSVYYTQSIEFYISICEHCVSTHTSLETLERLFLLREMFLGVKFEIF